MTDGRQCFVMKNPLDAVFAAPCHVAILRAMYRNSRPTSGRRIAREAGVNHQACAEGLRRLERLGLVQRQVLGRAHAFSLNQSHPVVGELLLPVFRREEGLMRGATSLAARADGQQACEPFVETAP